MKNIPFDFEKNQPPVLNQKMLLEEVERRKLIKQIRVLKISALLAAVCLALFALFIMHDSLIISLVCIAVLFVYLLGYSIVSIVFYSKGLNIQ